MYYWPGPDGEKIVIKGRHTDLLHSLCYTLKCIPFKCIGPSSKAVMITSAPFTVEENLWFLPNYHLSLQNRQDWVREITIWLAPLPSKPEEFRVVRHCWGLARTLLTPLPQMQYPAVSPVSSHFAFVVTCTDRVWTRENLHSSEERSWSDELKEDLRLVH